MAADKKILERIQAMLSRSARGTDETDASFAARQGEVENCISLAHKLMHDHNIELLDLPSGEANMKVDVKHDFVSTGKGSAFGLGWCVKLASAIDKCCYTSHIRVDDDRIAFIGAHTEVEVAKMMYVFIAEQAAERCRIARKATGLKGGTAPYKRFTLDFMAGCVGRCAVRMQEEIAMENSEAGTGLVRITAERNDAHMGAAFPGYKMTTTKGRPHTAAFVNGWHEGENVKLQKQAELQAAA